MDKEEGQSNQDNQNNSKMDIESSDNIEKVEENKGMAIEEIKTDEIKDNIITKPEFNQPEHIEGAKIIQKNMRKWLEKRKSF